VPDASNSLIHPTYKYLGREIRLAGLTLGQWMSIVAATVGAFGLSQILPFSDTINVSCAVTIAGTPAAAILAAGTGEMRLAALIRAAVRWRGRAHIHVPDPCAATPPDGYELTDDARLGDTAGPSPTTSLDLEALWAD
jgi:hypothetical protein